MYVCLQYACIQYEFIQYVYQTKLESIHIIKLLSYLHQTKVHEHLFPLRSYRKHSESSVIHNTTAIITMVFRLGEFTVVPFDHPSSLASADQFAAHQ